MKPSQRQPLRSARRIACKDDITSTSLRAPVAIGLQKFPALFPAPTEKFLRLSTRLPRTAGIVWQIICRSTQTPTRSFESSTIAVTWARAKSSLPTQYVLLLWAATIHKLFNSEFPPVREVAFES